MKLAHHPLTLRILALAGAILIPALLALGGLAALTSPVQADSQPGPGAAVPPGVAPPAIVPS